MEPLVIALIGVALILLPGIVEAWRGKTLRQVIDGYIEYFRGIGQSIKMRRQARWPSGEMAWKTKRVADLIRERDEVLKRVSDPAARKGIEHMYEAKIRSIQREEQP